MSCVTTSVASRGFAAAICCLAFASSHALAQFDPHGGMLRFPDVSAEHIAFVYANDIWVVPREGGAARPIASPPGAELFPRFSPDGKTIAFVGNYDGDRDVYTISIEGGVPARVTHHPATETISDWTPDGRIIFSMNGLAGLGRQQQIFTVSPEGGMPDRLPVPFGAAGTLGGENDEWLAYTPFNRDFRTWKRYRGGHASDIWLFNINTHKSKRITEWEGTDTIPMWHDGVVYYLSDEGAEERLNIWSYDVEADHREQITSYDDWDVKFPAIGPGDDGQGEIVFQHGGYLVLLDLGTRETRVVDVDIPGDRTRIRPRTIDVNEFIQGGGISATGKRAVVQARGDIWTLPAEEGALRNLSQSDGVFERDPAWSPDGRWIAYFADTTGEYELYITQSDGKGESKQLTEGSTTFYMDPVWSPDSTMIAFFDKAGNIWLHTIESGETTKVATDPYAFDFAPNTVNWSHDNRWLTFSLANENSMNTSVWVYNVESGEKHKVTSGMFSDSRPVFDRKGDYLYYVSARSFAPTYSDVDTTWIYNNSQVLLAAPLRADNASPFLPENDQEEWDEEKTEDEENGEQADDDADADELDDEETEPVEDDGVSGTWSCTVSGEGLPEGGLTVTLIINVADDNSVSGRVDTPMGGGSVSGTYDPAAGALNATITTDDGQTVTLNAKISDGSMDGTISGEGFSGSITGSRIATAGEGEDADEADEEGKPREQVEIDFEGFEARAIQLPVPPGSFGQTAVNNRNQLIYVRSGQRGAAGPASIKLFDISEDDPSEKTVASGAGAFDISGDGKKLLVVRGRSFSIQNAAAGASGKNVDTSNMKAVINPREEWEQIFHDAWRLQRIYFYDPNMHGLDWEAVRDHYEKMLADCVDREDVGYVIGEMIAEINVGHAYYGGGDTEDQPSESVGMLGIDFELADGAYRIAKIHEGGPWDSDARGPLSQPGVDVNEGDYLLAVNGVELDTTKDPWAAFVGLANQVVVLTVSENPTIDENAREVVVRTLSSESNLRYRSWIEENRRYVEEKTDGKVGYIYVPNTGVNGQNDLVRQFVGQTGMEALIIDERWNGGGQIPDRFVELLNRPVVNYWARRDQNDWPWPPVAHFGPKCMLINGPAGSGGDAFPYYFRQKGVGKLIGRRTWGGLVGISGTPGLIDNAGVTSPTFAFYETDGTWGIEGHGVDPDIDVIEDPALMWDGGDPQLDAAIDHMLDELERNPYVKPERPEYPIRTGIGIEEEDK